jgi:hypothetical protein
MSFTPAKDRGRAGRRIVSTAIHHRNEPIRSEDQNPSLVAGLPLRDSLGMIAQHFPLN